MEIVLQLSNLPCILELSSSLTVGLDFFLHTELIKLYGHKTELIEDISSKKVHAHRRVILQDRLNSLNIRTLKLEECRRDF